MTTMQIDIMKSDVVNLFCGSPMNAKLIVTCGADMHKESTVESAIKIIDTRIIDLNGVNEINNAPYPTFHGYPRRYREQIISNNGSGEYIFFNTTINFINGYCYGPELSVSFQGNNFQNYNQYFDLYYHYLSDPT
eukprot:184499_1